MSRFSTKEPENIKFSGELRVLRKLSEYEFGVEIWLMRDGINRNRSDYRNLDKHYETFLGTPILCAYVNGKIGDGHNMRERRDPRTGELSYSFTDGTAERIVGTISDEKKDLTLKERDGHTWIVAKGRLWSFYAPELVEKIVRTGRMDVSVETEVYEMAQDGDIEIFTAWTGLGVTILGDDVAPAIPGARIAALNAMQEEFRSLKLRAASFIPEKKPQKKQTRKGVKGQMNKQAIARLEPKFEGYKIVGLSDDGMRVALVDAKGCAFTYTFNEEDKGEVIAPKITPATMATAFAFEGEGNDVSVDMADIVDHVRMSAQAEDMEAKALRERLDKAEETIRKMEKAEHERRIQAVKDAVTRTLEAIHQAADEDDDDMEEEAEEIKKDAEQYAEMEKDGEFCGDKEACSELLAKCTEKRIARHSARNKKSFAWTANATETKGGDGIEGMLSYINR